MKKRILVISSANIDFVQKISRMPYSGETLVDREGSFEYIPGGKGSAGAVTFARLGADCVFACKTGADKNGEKLRELFKYEGIDTRFIVSDRESVTGMASVILEKGGKSRIVVFPGANDTMSEGELEDAFTCYPDSVYLQLELADETVLAACKMAARAGIPVFIDAAAAHQGLNLRELGPVEIFSPNESECRVFTGVIPSNEESALRAAIKLKNQVDAKYIVIKMGRHGAFMYDGSEYYVYPAQEIMPNSTVGAGDVFTAAMTYSYAQNQNIHSAIRMANLAAGMYITSGGTISSIPTLREIKEYRDNLADMSEREDDSNNSDDTAE